MTLLSKICLAVCCAVLIVPTIRAEREFSVFDNAMTAIKQPDQQAALLKELGYDGICTRPENATPEFFAAMDRHGIDVTATYVVIPVKGDAQELPPNIVKHVETLKGRQTIVWLALAGREATDSAAVSIIRKVCDLAAEQSLEVALYAHVAFKTDTEVECERLRKLADRPNLGISFNLCHFLCQSDSKNLETAIKAAAPHLKLVQISGADQIPPGKPDWSRLIQPLGAGSFDIERVFRALDEADYQGPINLQCFQIKLPAKQHLAASMRAWKKLNLPSSKP